MIISDTQLKKNHINFKNYTSTLEPVKHHSFVDTNWWFLLSILQEGKKSRIIINSYICLLWAYGDLNGMNAEFICFPKKITKMFWLSP